MPVSRLSTSIARRFFCCCTSNAGRIEPKSVRSTNAMTNKWNYADLGPSQWPQFFPAAKGQRQSPVDLKFADARPSDRLKNSLRVDFGVVQRLVGTNTGSSLLFNIPRDVASNHAVSGGPLTEKYELAQFHFHWGSADENGSEHWIDSKQYSAECHFVLWNTELHSSANEALSQEKGLCVLGILLQTGSKTGDELKKLTSRLDDLKVKGSEITLAERVDLTALLPDSSAYFTYNGSLTTPPCYETVTWIVYRDPVVVSQDDIAKMRRLEDEDGRPIARNFRPTQDLNGRLIFRSF